MNDNVPSLSFPVPSARRPLLASKRRQRRAHLARAFEEDEEKSRRQYVTLATAILEGCMVGIVWPSSLCCCFIFEFESLASYWIHRHSLSRVAREMVNWSRSNTSWSLLLLPPNEGSIEGALLDWWNLTIITDDFQTRFRVSRANRISYENSCKLAQLILLAFLSRQRIRPLRGLQPI